MAFPTTSILDNFNRADGPIGSNWTEDWYPYAAHIDSGICRHGYTYGTTGWSEAHWNVETCGPDCEVYVTVAGTIDVNKAWIALMWRGGPGLTSTYYLQVYAGDTDGNNLSTYTSWYLMTDGLLASGSVAEAFAAGMKWGVSMTGAEVSIYHAPVGGAWTLLDTFTDPQPITGAGYIGFEVSDGVDSEADVAIDDFGGGTIVTAAPPVADFSADVTSGVAPLTVTFTDASTNSPTSWLWDFGDGTTSTLQNPSHIYVTGIYAVTLTATNASGSDAETKTVYIVVTGPIVGGGPGGGVLGRLVANLGSPVDISEDMRATEPIVIHYGIDGSGPTDRVASTGTMTWALDNSEHNSAGLLGYYAPGHANCLAGFEVGMQVQLAVTYRGVTYTKFRGTLETIDPTSGKYLERATRCQAVDWMDEAAKQKIRLLPTQIDQRAENLIATIVAAMPVAPTETSYATGDSIFPYSLDNARDEKSSPMSEFQRIALSELGFIYVKGDTANGGVLTFQARSTRPSALASLVTIDDTMTGMSVSRKRSAIYNRIRVTTHPRRIDAAATTVLFELTAKPKVGAGKSITLVGQYRDPTQKSVRCGGMDMLAPVATTDYTANTQSDGGGSDLTSDFVVTAYYGGNGVQLVVANNGASDGYVTLLQCRGRGVYDDNPVVSEAEDATSITTYSEHGLAIDMPMQDDSSVGQDAADYLLAAWKDPHSAIDAIEFVGNSSVDLMTAGLALEPGDRVTIQETATGISGDYVINGVTMTIYAGGIYRFGWTVAPMAQSEATGLWLIGVATRSEIGETTVVGY